MKLYAILWFLGLSFIIPWMIVVTNSINHHDKIINQQHQRMCTEYPDFCKS